MLQVIAAAKFRTIRLRTGLMGIMCISILAALSYWLVSAGLESRDVWITSSMLLVLMANMVLMYYRNSLERASSNFCMDDEKCFMMTSDSIIVKSVVYLKHGSDILVIGKDPGLCKPATKHLHFRVLDRQDWDQLRDRLQLVVPGHDNTRTLNPISIVSKQAAI